ncbi:hypothetical protein [Desulfallas thermosapovorans]|uniref:Uncharacterized protein n=1 Tax=Desulfallas thermosapovorans DSM 6562 TaxID=1121431 RepID=A0A5S4ZRQ8_9FIRM|nr:hypothetical protein [Desulfallas thermosapovorans]TYO95597.1 hypothetical protein LX24_01559 [Desulfallas thermosapovorans DSM 6562]
MFFIVVSRVKDKILLFARLVLVICILCILIAQLYGILKTSVIEHDKTTSDPLRVEQHHAPAAFFCLKY